MALKVAAAAVVTVKIGADTGSFLKARLENMLKYSSCVEARSFSVTSMSLSAPLCLWTLSPDCCKMLLSRVV